MVRNGFAVIFIFLVGCASSHVLVGKVRPAISPDQVKLYLKPPLKFEEVALLEASSKSSWSFTDQGKMNKAVQRLKDEAARLGANGVLLQGSGSESSGSINTGNATSTGYGGVTMAAIHKSASGIAIFVFEE